MTDLACSLCGVAPLRPPKSPATSGGLPAVEWSGFTYCPGCAVVAIEYSPAAMMQRARAAYFAGDEEEHYFLQTAGTWLEGFAQNNPRELP